MSTTQTNGDGDKESDFDFVQEVRLRASEEEVWDALTEVEQVKKYYLAPPLKLEMKTGGEILFGNADEVMISGEVLEVRKPDRWVHTFRFGPQLRDGAEGDPDTVVSYAIRRDGDETILKLVHSGFTEENQTRADISGGWPIIMSGLKKVVEEGR
ncbi:SRPBCC domain-containing protein [Phragmitibacter flavus]|nr:SRPBCC domain-containing protein [Phragmitibacter flavus]